MKYEDQPWLWDLTAYGRGTRRTALFALKRSDFHYARRRSDDSVERHPNYRPCPCPNAAEYGGTYQGFRR